LADFDLSNVGILSDADINLFRIGGAGRDPNFCIKDVRLGEGGEVVAGLPGRLEVTVSNRSDRADSRLVQIYLSDLKLDQKSIELDAGRDGEVSFDILVEKPGGAMARSGCLSDRLSAMTYSISH